MHGQMDTSLSIGVVKNNRLIRSIKDILNENNAIFKKQKHIVLHSCWTVIPLFEDK